MAAWIRRCGFAVVLATAFSLAVFAQPADLARRAEAEFDVGHGAEAIALWRQALSGYRAAGDAQGELRVLIRLGSTSSLIGKYAEASEYLAEALKLARRAGMTALETEILAKLADAASRAGNGPLAITANRDLLARAEASGDTATAAVAAARLGQALLDAGQPQAAAPAFRRAAELFGLRDAHENEAAAFNYLGEALLKQEDYVAANEAYRQAVRAARQAVNPELEAKALHGIGVSLYYLGDYPAATGALNNAISVARRDRQRKTEASALMSLGNVEYFLGNTAEAIKNYEEALAAARNLKDPTMEGRALGNLGLALAQARQYERSAEYFQQDIANARARGDRLDEAQALGNLAAQLIEQGRYADAIPPLMKSRELAQEIGYRRGEAVALRNLGFAQLRNGQPTEAEASLRRSIALQESLREQTTAIDSFNVSLFETQRDAYRTLQAALVAQSRPDAALEISEYGRARALADLMTKRGSASAPTAVPTIETFRNLARTRRVTFVEFSFVPADHAIYAWVIRPDGTTHFRRTGFEVHGSSIDSAIEGMVRDMRAVLGALGSKDVPVPKPGIAGRDEMLALFHRLMIAPIAQWLPTSPTEPVVLVPQGPLFLLPYAALPDAQGKAMIDSHTLVVAPSIETFARLGGKRGALTARAVVAGNPTMSEVKLGPSAEPELLEQLPGAEREALVVAELLDARPLIGREATKAAILRRAPTVDVIHLATHGVAQDVRGDGVPGAVVLAANDRDDGLLTTSEIMGLRLQAGLVVLSACNTGLGNIRSEGVIGLSRAFLAAGAQSVVVSLWRVPDQPTAELMQEFYRTLAAAPNKAAALRQAMLATRARHPDPLSWAGFILVGESE